MKKCLKLEIELNTDSDGLVHGEKFINVSGSAALQILQNYSNLMEFYKMGLRMFRILKRSRFEDQYATYRPIPYADSHYRDEFCMVYTTNMRELQHSRRTYDCWGNPQYSDCPTIHDQVGNVPLIAHYRGQNDEHVTLYL